MSIQFQILASPDKACRRGDRAPTWSIANSDKLAARLTEAESSEKPTGQDGKSFYEQLTWDFRLLRRILRVAATTSFQPAPLHTRLRRRLKLYLNCAAKWSVLRAWHERHSGVLNADILERHPLFPVLTRRPYVNSTWPLSKSQAIIEGHYRFVRERADALSFPLAAEQEIAKIRVDLPGLRVSLDKSAWFQNEGEVVLNLFLGDARVYSLAFSLGYESGEAVAYIGAIQGGGHGIEPLQRNRLITRRSFGMRSRDLLFAAFRILCSELNIQRILAAGNACSVVDSQYFGGGTRYRHADYDEIWAEYGGTACVHDGMFQIPVPLHFRERCDIPSKKKEMYRQRYEMLRALQSDIARAIGRHGSVDAT